MKRQLYDYVSFRTYSNPQLSLSRLDQLEQQCLSWRGAPLSAAVYLPLLFSEQGNAWDRSTGSTKNAGVREGRGGNESTGFVSMRNQRWLLTDAGAPLGLDAAHTSTNSWYKPSGPTLNLPERLRDAIYSAISRMDSLVTKWVSVGPMWSPAERGAFF